jgi:ribosome-associated translation inhibitor RaiA
MHLQLQGAYLHFFPDLRAYVERRLERALSRLKEPEPHATVRLSGKTRWTCQVRLAIPGRAPIAARAAAPLPSEAIDGAMERLGPKLLRLLRRSSQQHFRPGSINREGPPR